MGLCLKILKFLEKFMTKLRLFVLISQLLDSEKNTLRTMKKNINQNNTIV